MAEDDEVDILGDCSLDSFLPKDETIFQTASLGTQTSDLMKCDDLVSQNSDLLKCDYTIHPQWLLDKPSTNPACWYNSGSDFSPDLGSQTDLEYNSSGVPQISTENSITDESGWTEKEKNLLSRGIEIFGKSNVRLSQFIGSKDPSEVKYYLKNFYTDIQLSDIGGNIFDSECIQETVVLSQNHVLEDIPASIEEVIAVVSTAKPTVTVNNRKGKVKRNVSNLSFKINVNEIPSGQSLLKSNFYKHVDKRHSLNSNSIREQSKQIVNIETKKAIKFKFKTKLKVVKKVNSIKKRRRSTKSENSSRVASERNDVEIVTGKGLSVPVCTGEEVIKIKKETTTSDSDVEIDIEDTDTEPDKIIENTCRDVDDKVDSKIISKGTQVVEETDNNPVSQKKVPDLSELPEKDVNELMSTELPKCEYILNDNSVTQLEKFMHFEFFEGRPTKTPIRYLKIRNHILNVWKSIRPNYVTKTSIRQGLKQCGDVNCIGRIHQFLEQIGAINFGCPQITYIRPLHELVVANMTPKDKVVKDVEVPALPQKYECCYRSRNKKKYINDGEGGYTLTHDERGEIINTTVVNEEPVSKQRSSYLKKPIVRLIYCRPFNEEKPQEYGLQIHSSVLLLMDLHAHTSLSEIMGLVGGRWNEQSKILSITRYEPCKNIAASSTHCDMCPITQAKAAEILHEENLDVVGWFHSHPTFAPEPSQQDIDTQLSVQQWIGHNKPCVGVIMSPFSSHGALISSPYRCMIVDKKANFDDQHVPYKFKVEVISVDVKVDDLLNRAWNVFNSEYIGVNGSKVDFRKPYFLDHSITYLDKFISSVKMHLAKCSDINKMTCDAILQGLSDICGNNL